VSAELPEALPAALAGKAGFDLEFLPAAYFHKSFKVDGAAGIFPRYPASAMQQTPERNAARGRARRRCRSSAGAASCWRRKTPRTASP
jgi:hypothetical protein